MSDQEDLEMIFDYEESSSSSSSESDDHSLFLVNNLYKYQCTHSRYLAIVVACIDLNESDQFVQLNRLIYVKIQ